MKNLTDGLLKTLNIDIKPTQKKCSKKDCSFKGEFQPIENFCKSSRNPDGLQYWCKSCRKEEDQKHYIVNKEIINQKQNQRIKNFSKNPNISEKKCSVKTCVFNGEPQPVENFSHNKRSIDGYAHMCKACKKIKMGEYRKNNSEKIKLSHKKDYEKNKIEINKHTRENAHKPALYNTYYNKIEKYEEVKQDPNNNKLLQVKCSNCDKFFNPTNRQVRLRMNAINGTVSMGTENRFYCSESCKKECPVFKKVKKSKLESLKDTISRPLQGQLRELVLERDEYECQICGAIDVELICHHITGVMQNPIESADIDNCITVCKKCENHVHSLPGCKRSDLTCASLKKSSDSYEN